MISKNDFNVFGLYQRILLQANEFICLLPHPGLTEYISNYNITFPTKELIPTGFTVMPSGCSTLTIEDDSDHLSICLNGPAAKPYVTGNRTSQLEMFITIEFKPAGLYAFTGINQYELADQSVSFDIINPQLNQALSDVVEKSANIAGLTASLDRLLLEHISAAHQPRLILTLQNIIRCAGDITVKSLSDDIHYSERQLNRIFRQHVGVSAKSFARLVRINNSFRLLKKPDNSLTFISDVLGFHDLSHFIRDFKSVCGITPQEYRDNMSDFYINPIKF